MWSTACDGNDCLHSLSYTLEVFSVFDAELFFPVSGANYSFGWLYDGKSNFSEANKRHLCFDR